MGAVDGGVEGEHHTREEKVLKEEEFSVGKFGYQVFGISEGKCGISHGNYGFLCQESKHCAGVINLGDVDITEAVIVDEIFWRQKESLRQNAEKYQ